MWAWLKRVKKVPEHIKRQAEIVGKGRELMGLMENWQDFAGKSNEEIATVLMNIGLGHIEAIYKGHLLIQEGRRRRQAHLN